MADSSGSAGPSPRGRRRLRRHGLIAGGSLAGTGLLALAFHGDARERISLASAFVAFGLLGVTLSLGPLNVLRGRSTPVSFDLRRDFGIWSATLGVAHSVIGLTVHLRGRMYLYFLAPPDARGFFGLRVDPFGAANYSGLLAALLLLLLAAISNDFALRTLRTRRWRAIQRWAYVILALAIAHGAAYQLIEKQRVILVLWFLLMAVGSVAIQLFARRRGRSAAKYAQQ